MDEREKKKRNDVHGGNSTVMARGWISVSAILTNVTQKEAAWSSGATKGRHCPLLKLSCPEAVEHEGHRRVAACCRASRVPLANWFAFTPQRASAVPPLARATTGGEGAYINPSAFTLQNHIIHLFTHLSILSLARHCLVHRVTGSMCCLLSSPEIATVRRSLRSLNPFPEI